MVKLNLSECFFFRERSVLNVLFRINGENNTRLRNRKSVHCTDIFEISPRKDDCVSYSHISKVLVESPDPDPAAGYHLHHKESD
jgi:hypothetical protein